MRPTRIALLVLALVALVLVFAPSGEGSVTATARQTDDPNVVKLIVKATVKRPLERRVFAEACGLPVLACDALEVSKRVRLHKGRNTVTLQVRRLVYEFVGTQVTGTPWDGYRMVPAPVDTIWVRFGQYGRAREVRPSPVDVTP